MIGWGGVFHVVCHLLLALNLLGNGGGNNNNIFMAKGWLWTDLYDPWIYFFFIASYPILFPNKREVLDCD